MRYYSFLLFMLAGAAAFAQVDRSQAPKAGPAPQIQLGKYESFKMKNGMQVFVVENHKIPRVAFQMSLDVSPILQKDKAGYVDIAGQMLRTGTATRTKAQIDEEVDFIGAALYPSSTGIYAASLKKHADKLLNIMADVAQRPSFPKEEFEKIKKRSISGLASSKDNANAIMASIKNQVLFGENHPYGETTTEASLSKITVEDCKAYYDAYFKPNVAYMVVVGDINVKEAKALLEKYFGKWKSGTVGQLSYAAPKKLEGNKVVFVHKQGAVQSVISVAHAVELKTGDPDAISASVATTILGGGGFSGRLMQNLRETKAYTYGAYASLTPNRLAGNFNANASVRNAVTDSSVTEFLYEMTRMNDETVSQEDLQLTINQMTGSFARSLESPQTVARFALNTAMYKLPADYYATYLKKLSVVTPKDVQAAAKKYINHKNAYIVVVGDKEIAPKLERFSADGKIAYYDTDGKAVDPAKSSATPAGLTGETVIEKYLEAIGGRKNIAAVQEIESQLTAGMGGMNMNVNVYQKGPGKFALMMATGQMVVQKKICDGQKVLAGGMGGSKMLEGKELQEEVEQAVIMVESKYKELGYTLALKGSEDVNGKTAYIVEVVAPSGRKTTDYFDAETGLRVKSLQTSNTPQGPVSTTLEFKDYREVKGIKMPYEVNQKMGPMNVALKVVSLKVNEGIDDSVFKVE